MLFPLYQSIKSRLQLFVVDLKDIQWYNVQYAGVIHAECLAFIEFPEELQLEEISKNTTRSDVSVRIHILSRAIPDADNTIPDPQIITHDSLVQLIATTLRFYIPLNEAGQPLATKLFQRRYKIVHDYKGWLVTHLTFTTKVML